MRDAGVSLKCYAKLMNRNRKKQKTDGLFQVMGTVALRVESHCSYLHSSQSQPVHSFPDGSAGKDLPAMQETQETLGGSLDWEDPLEEENGNPLQYSCLKNPMDRGAWQATVHGVTRSQT